VPGKTTATINRERRDALYELVLNHVNSLGDLWVAMEERTSPRPSASASSTAKTSG
jgi:hypothetical protein